MPDTSSTPSEQGPPPADRPQYASLPGLTLPAGYINPGVLKFSTDMPAPPDQGMGSAQGGDDSAGPSSGMAATPSGPTQYRYGWTAPYAAGSGGETTASAPDMSRRVTSVSAADIRYPGEQYTSPMLQGRAASVAEMGNTGDGERGSTLPSIATQYGSQGYSPEAGGPAQAGSRGTHDPRTTLGSILLNEGGQGLQTPFTQRSMGAYASRYATGGTSFGSSVGFATQESNAAGGPSAASGLQGLHMGTGGGVSYSQELPPMGSSEAPSSGSRKREHGSRAGPDSDEDPPASDPLGHLASDDQQQFKRGRGRPRGSKTKTRSGMYSPDDSLPHVGALLDASAAPAPQYTQMHGMPTDNVVQSILRGREQGNLPMTPMTASRPSYTQRQPVTTVDEFAAAMTSIEGGFYQAVSELVSRTGGDILGESSAAAGGNATRAQQVLAEAVQNVKNVSGAFVLPRSITMPSSTSRFHDPSGQLSGPAQPGSSTGTYQAQMAGTVPLAPPGQAGASTGSVASYQLPPVSSSERPFSGPSFPGYPYGRQAIGGQGSAGTEYEAVSAPGSSMPGIFGSNTMAQGGTSIKYDTLPGLAYPTAVLPPVSTASLSASLAGSSGGSAFPSWQQQSGSSHRPPLLPPPIQTGPFVPLAGGPATTADPHFRPFAPRTDLPRIDPGQSGLIAGPYSSGARFSADYSSDIYQPTGGAGDYPQAGSSSSQVEASGEPRHPSSEDSPSDSAHRRRARSVVHGPWKESEAERLTGLVHASKGRNPKLAAEEVDWDWVVEEFGPSRSRHQILIKATYLGLKPTSTHSSRLVRQKQFQGREEEVPGITAEKLDRIRAEKAAEAAAAGAFGHSASPRRLGTMDSLAQRLDQTGRGSIGEGDTMQRAGDQNFTRSSLSGFDSGLPSMQQMVPYYPSYPTEQQARPSTSGSMTYMGPTGGNRGPGG